MARTKNPVNTCKENSGKKNMTPEALKSLNTKYDDLNKKVVNKLLIMDRIRQPYSGSWEEDDFKESIKNFFEYCGENSIEPSKPLLATWLGTNRKTIWKWETDESMGFKHDIICQAIQFMECVYFSKLDESFPSASFKLKSNNFAGFNYVEASRLDITTNGNNLGSDSDEVKDLVSKLGLNEVKK